jgi:hypothetical protein
MIYHKTEPCFQVTVFLLEEIKQAQPPGAFLEELFRFGYFVTMVSII